jgi:flagellar assembly factor FliW
MTTTLAFSTSDRAISTDQSVRFITGMPGLDQYTRFTLVPIDDSPVYWLRCDDEPGIMLPVAEAFAVSNTYTVDLNDADRHDLALATPDDALVLTVLTLAMDCDQITANLVAPVVINRRTWAAKQVILDTTHYSIRQPLASLTNEYPPR